MADRAERKSAELEAGSRFENASTTRKMFLVTGPWSFLMSAVAITAGTFISDWHQVSPLLYVLALLMVVPIHASANLLNDCYDVMTGADRPGTQALKPHPVLSGFLSLRATVVYAAAMMAVGLGSGVALTAMERPFSLVIVAAAVVLMISYNAPPLRLKDKGMGELLVFVVWGPLMFLGAHYLQTGSLALEAVVYSVPLGMLVASVLLVDDARDVDEDRSIGRTTVATLLGQRRALEAYDWVVALSYVLTVALSVLLDRPWLLIVLLSAPLALRLTKAFAARLPLVAPDRKAAQLMAAFGLLYAVALAA